MLTAAQSHAESTDKDSWHHQTQLLQVRAALSAWGDLHDKGKLPSKLLIVSLQLAKANMGILIWKTQEFLSECEQKCSTGAVACVSRLNQ